MLTFKSKLILNNLNIRKFATTTTSSSSPIIIDKLSNGIKLVVDPTPSYFSAIGFYINAGSRYEKTYDLTGCSHLMDKMSFKSTENFTLEEINKQLNKLGGNYMCSSSRESMIYQASTFNDDVDKMFNILSETVTKPKILKSELDEQLLGTEYELNEIWNQSDLILPEIFQQIAYNNSNLGNPLLCPFDKLSKINKNSLIKYRELFYNPENLVIAFSGIEYNKALKLIETYLSDFKSNNSNKIIKEKALYTGGEFSLPIPEGLNYRGEEFHHIYIGFEGLSIESNDIYKLAILQMLIGGGGSFSAGGPGKGMYSRAYTRILNQYGFVENCKSFIHNFTDSGLFGISLACVPQANRVMSELIGYELNLLMSKDIGKGGISDQEVLRAKNQLKSSLMMNLESKMVQLEDMGRQVQIYGKRIDVLEMCEKINNVNRNDIINIAEKIFTSSEPTIVVQGDRESFGDIKGMLTKYGLGKKSEIFENFEKKKSNKWF